MEDEVTIIHRDDDRIKDSLLDLIKRLLKVFETLSIFKSQDKMKDLLNTLRTLVEKKEHLYMQLYCSLHGVNLLFKPATNDDILFIINLLCSFEIYSSDKLNEKCMLALQPKIMSREFRGLVHCHLYYLVPIVEAYQRIKNAEFELASKKMKLFRNRKERIQGHSNE